MVDDETGKPAATVTTTDPEVDAAQNQALDDLLGSSPQLLSRDDPRVARLSRFSVISAMSTALPDIFERAIFDAIVMGVCGTMAAEVIDSARGNTHQIHDAIGALDRRGYITRELFEELRRALIDPAHQEQVDEVCEAWFEPAPDRFTQLGDLLLSLFAAGPLAAVLGSIEYGNEIRKAIISIPQKSDVVYIRDVLDTMRRRGLIQPTLFEEMYKRPMTPEKKAIIEHLYAMYRARGVC